MESLIGIAALLVYLAVVVAMMLHIWYLYKFFDAQEKKTEATRYLTKFYFVAFIIGCIGITAQTAMFVRS